MKNMLGKKNNVFVEISTLTQFYGKSYPDVAQSARTYSSSISKAGRDKPQLSFPIRAELCCANRLFGAAYCKGTKSGSLRSLSGLAHTHKAYKRGKTETVIQGLENHKLLMSRLN
jgi:hypothetical protein